MPIIKIKYKPRNWAKLLHNTAKKLIVLVLHRRAGKTTAAINHLNRDALRTAKTKYAYVAPTYKQAKRIVWDMIKEYTKSVPGIKYNESELKVYYPNGSTLMVVGSDNPDSLRGIGLHGAFCDEYAQQNPIIFTEILSKCVADTGGYIIFGATPKGKGPFYKVYQVAKDDEDWLCIYKTIDQSLKEESGEVIEHLKNALERDKKLVKQGIMTEDEFQQEWYNSFEASLKGAVYLKELAKAREDGRIGMAPYDPGQPVYTVWDLGINDAMAIGFYQHIGGTPRMIDYYENTGLGLPHYAKVIKEKPYVYGKHFAPHDINQRELSTGKTRLDSAKKLGIDFEVIPGVSLVDGIDQGRRFFYTLYIDSKKCQGFLDLIGMYQYKKDENTGILSNKPIHDHTSHAADVHRYASLVEDQMRTDEPVIDPPDDDYDFYDEYKGTEDPDDDGQRRHPMLKGVDLGKM
jgi:hypothetical protein